MFRTPFLYMFVLHVLSRETAKESGLFGIGIK